jgi:hypothetical protein
MSRPYQAIIKALGVISVAMLLVAAILYLNRNRTNAEIALGVSASIAGIAIMMYSLRR